MMKHSLLTLVVALLASAAPLHAADAPAAGQKPNVIFFLLDDMGYMDIGANNPKTFYETPNIDKLAATGMRFTDGYAACPVCSPTRASIMTGKYPPRTGVTDYIGGHKTGALIPAPNANHIALEETTIAEALRDAGYATFFSGKWHLGDGQFSPNAQGFSGVLGKSYEYYPPNNDPNLPSAQDDPKKTDRVVSDFLAFLGGHKDKPFFAYLPFTAVHQKIGARADLVAKYQKKQNNAPAPKPDGEQDYKRGRQQPVQNNAVYAGMIDQLDSAVGRVIAAIDKAGLTDRTIIIFMSDNGGLSTAERSPTSNLPLRAGKGWLYEGGIREPMIIRAPDVTKPGSVCSTPVISTDFYPTILELAGLPPMPKQHVDGVSLAPLLKGGKLERGPLYWHYPHYGNQGGAPGGAIRDGEWKLIEWFGTPTPELYNLASDLGERHDVAAQNPDKVKELQTKLAAWRKDVNAIMPTAAKRSKGQASASTPAVSGTSTEEES